MSSFPTTAPAPLTAPPTAPAADAHTWQHLTKVNYLRYLHTPQGKAEFRLGFPVFGVIITILLFLTIVGIPAAIGHVIGMVVVQSRRRKKFDQAVATAKRAEVMFVYPIMVNTRLRQFDNQRAPGLVMGAFEDIGEEYFVQLAQVLGPISSAPPGTLAPAEEALREALTNEKYVDGRRRRIPDEFTGGVAVYLFDLMIDGRKLPDRRVTIPRILCMATPGDRGIIFNLPHFVIDPTRLDPSAGAQGPQ